MTQLPENNLSALSETNVRTGPKGTEEDLSVDLEEEQPSFTIDADEELANLMNDQQTYDFATRLSYIEASEQNEVFETFLTRYFFSKKFLLAEAVLAGADIAYTALTNQPSTKALELFGIGNTALIGAGFAGKIVSYFQTRQKVNKAIRYMAKSVLLKEQISEKVETLHEEQNCSDQSDIEKVSTNEKTPKNNDYSMPYIR